MALVKLKRRNSSSGIWYSQAQTTRS